MLGVALYRKLAHDGEAYLVVRFAEFYDFLDAAGFLSAKVVTGESKDDEAVGFLFFVEFLEAFVLLGEAALGGHVDYEYGLTFEVGEGGLFALGSRERDLGNVCGKGGRAEDDGGYDDFM